MSHVCSVDIEIKSLEDLEAAAHSLGMELKRGQRTYRWFGKHVGDYPLPAGFEPRELGTCEHAIRVPLKVPGADRVYEVGVAKRKDGKPGYVLLWDFWNQGRCAYATGECGDDRRTDYRDNPHQTNLQQYVGDNACKLRQAYARAAAIRTAQQQGFRVQEHRQQDGTIKLVFQKG